MKKFLIILLATVFMLTLPLGVAASEWETEMDTEIGQTVPGDIDGNGTVDNLDVEYLLWHTLFPEDNPITLDADFDQNGAVDNLDVEYLLWHTLFPEDNPLP